MLLITSLEPRVDMGGKQKRIVQKPHVFQSLHAWHGMVWVVVPNEFQSSPNFFLKSQNVKYSVERIRKKLPTLKTLPIY